MTLMNLCYLVKSDPDAMFSEEEFSIIAGSILGMTGSIEIKTKDANGSAISIDSADIPQLKSTGKPAESEMTKRKFVQSIYKWVSSDKHTRKSEATIQQFFLIFQDMARQNNSNFEYDFILVSRFKNFLMDITNRNKKAYLVKFDVDQFYVE